MFSIFNTDFSNLRKPWIPRWCADKFQNPYYHSIQKISIYDSILPFLSEHWTIGTKQQNSNSMLSNIPNESRINRKKRTGATP